MAFRRGLTPRAHVWTHLLNAGRTRFLDLPHFAVRGPSGKEIGLGEIVQCCTVGVGESFRSGESFLLSKLFLGERWKVVFKEEWRRPAKPAGDPSVEICMQL